MAVEGVKSLVYKNKILMDEVERLKTVSEDVMAEHERISSDSHYKIKNLEEQFAEEKSLFWKEIDPSKHGLIVAENSVSADKKKAYDELLEWGNMCKLLRADVDRLRSKRNAAQKSTKEWKMKAEAVVVPPVAATPLPVVATPSAHEIIEEYKKSDEFIVEMSNTGEDASRILRDALIAGVLYPKMF